MPPRPVILPFSLAVAALTLAGHSADAQSRIGVASAVKNDVRGNSGALSVGSSVFSNERIKTGDAATAQLMFVDKTVLSMGPRAELLLDKYVYNPNRGTGQVVVNAVQGSMRFVTGAQNPTNYAIKTPVATLGIRGTVVDLDIGEEIFIGVLQGEVKVTLLDGTVFTVTSGQSIWISKDGKSARNGGSYKGDGSPTNPEFPAEVRVGDIDQLNALDAAKYKVPKPSCVPYSNSLSYCYPSYD
ncbi:MAG: FecR domain-containing protein [Pseudorhodoplanes sp.]|uniref:FecR family protein n=1 Tax=Pseudorhodoplanes sp. TaxID=1934341 RepID=UPI003D0BD4C7